MRIIKYYEHAVNPGEVVPLRLHSLEEIIADRVCYLLNNEYKEYGNNVVEIEFRRADVQDIHCYNRREAWFTLVLSSRNGIIGCITVTINYNTNELLSVESNIEYLFNRALFKTLSFKLTENEKEKKGMKIMISLDEFESVCKKACCEFFSDNQKEDRYCFATNNREIDTDKMVLKVELSFIPNNVQKLKHNVRFIFDGISGDVAYASYPNLPAGEGNTICAIICSKIRSQFRYIDTDTAYALKNDPAVQYCLNDILTQSKLVTMHSEYLSRRNEHKVMLKSLHKVMLKSLYENQFEIDKVIINEPAMIVFWKDGTKTVVTAKDEAFDPEKGLAMAFAKKALGNNYAAGGKFKAKLKHAQVIKGKEEGNKTKDTDSGNEIFEEAKKPAEKKMTKTAWVKMMMSEMGYTRKQASEAWDQNHK